MLQREKMESLEFIIYLFFYLSSVFHIILSVCVCVCVCVWIYFCGGSAFWMHEWTTILENGTAF